jgi:hypothetical protein
MGFPNRRLYLVLLFFDVWVKRARRREEEEKKKSRAYQNALSKAVRDDGGGTIPENTR